MKHCILLTALLSFFLGFPASGQSRPNILIIVADDMGVDALGMYGIGAESPRTPHLDALAEEGIRFENVWAYPVCSPTRAAALSGLYGNKTGVLNVPGNLPLSYTTLFEHVEEITSDTYAKAAIGKWHIAARNSQTDPNDQGVEHFVGSISGAVADYFDWSRVENGMSASSTDYVTSHITDEAIAWIDQQTTPWFLWLAHTAPHSPFHVPPDTLFTRTSTNGNLNQYLAMIEAMDHEIGRLLASMSDVERANTLIIFVGDNGTPNQVLQGYPNRRGKGSLYQGGVNVPMIAAGYGVARVHETEDALIQVVDLYATVSEVVGPDLPGGVNNSFSFKDVLSDPSATTRPYNFSEIGSGTEADFTIRNERYKLMLFADGRREFYDLLNDPFELTELLGAGITSEQAVQLAELEAEGITQRTGWSCNDGIQNGTEQEGTCNMAPTTLDIPTLPEGFGVDQNVPNPFQSMTNIQYKVPSTGAVVTLQIFDINGRRIRTLVDGSSVVGNHTVSWDGMDDKGQAMASGIYMYRLTTGDSVQSRMMVLVK